MSFKQLGIAVAFVSSIVGSVEAAIVSGARTVGAFYSDDDDFRHAIIAQTNGDVTEVFYNEHTGGVYYAWLANFSDIVSVSGYYSRHTHYRHAIVGLKNGNVWDVRYRPDVGVWQGLILRTAGWGSLRAVVGWEDDVQHQNIAFLTKWGSDSVIGVFQDGQTYFSAIYGPNQWVNDIAGHYQKWNHSNMIEIATGSPSSVQQASWDQNIVPDQLNLDWADPNSNTPWATNYPGPNGVRDTIVSLSASDQFCYYSDFWSGKSQIAYLTAQNQLYTFNVNNGGGTAFLDWSFDYGPQVQSVAGPFLTSVYNNCPNHTVVAMDNGDVFDMSAVDNSPQAPKWVYMYLGNF